MAFLCVRWALDLHFSLWNARSVNAFRSPEAHECVIRQQPSCWGFIAFLECSMFSWHVFIAE